MPEVVCCACASVNRLPADRPSQAAKCGRCSSLLFQGKPCNVTADDLRKHIQRNTIPVLVDAWAPWCGPCRTMAPAYEKAASVLEPTLRLLKLNCDEQSDAASRLGIGGLPSLILFQNGQEVARIAGAMTASQIVAWVGTAMRNTRSRAS